MSCAAPSTPCSKLGLPHRSQLGRPHELDAGWRFRRYLQAQTAAGVPWRVLFWRVWGVLTVLRCAACGVCVPAAHFCDRCHDGDPHQVRAVRSSSLCLSLWTSSAREFAACLGPCADASTRMQAHHATSVAPLRSRMRSQRFHFATACRSGRYPSTITSRTPCCTIMGVSCAHQQ